MLDSAGSSHSVSLLNTAGENSNEAVGLNPRVIKGSQLCKPFLPIAKQSLLEHAKDRREQLSKIDSSTLFKRFPVLATNWSEIYRHVHEKGSGDAQNLNALTQSIDRLLDVISAGTPEITLPEDLTRIYGKEGILRRLLASQVRSKSMLMLLQNITAFANKLTQLPHQEQAKYLVMWPGDPPGSCVPALNKDLYAVLSHMLSDRDIINDSATDYINNSIQAYKLTRGVHRGNHTHIPIAIENSSYLPNALAQEKDSFVRVPLKSLPARRVYRVISGLSQGAAKKLTDIVNSELADIAKILEHFIGDGKRSQFDAEHSAFPDSEMAEILMDSPIFKAISQGDKAFNIQKYLFENIMIFDDNNEYLVTADLSHLANKYQQAIENQYLTAQTDSDIHRLFDKAFCVTHEVVDKITADLASHNSHKASTAIDLLHTLSSEFKGGSLPLLGGILQQLGEQDKSNASDRRGEKSEYADVAAGMRYLEKVIAPHDQLARDKLMDINRSMDKLHRLEKSLSGKIVNLRAAQPAAGYNADLQRKIFRVLLENNAPMSTLSGLEALVEEASVRKVPGKKVPEDKKLEVNPTNLLFHPQKKEIIARYGNHICLDKSQCASFVDNCATVDDVAMLIKFLPDIIDPKALGFNNSGETPAHTAIENNSLKVLSNLCNQGCANLRGIDLINADGTISKGVTPIMKAAVDGNHKAMAVLLDSDKVEYPAAERMNPLFAAAYYGHFDVVNLLVNSPKAVQPAMVADTVYALTTGGKATHNYTKTLNMLLNSPHIDHISNKANPHDVSLFHVLASHNSKEHALMLRALLSSPKTPDPNRECFDLQRNDFVSPINIAIVQNNVNIAREFLASKRIKIPPYQYDQLCRNADNTGSTEMSQLLTEYRDVMLKRSAPPTLGDGVKYIVNNISTLGEQLRKNSLLAEQISKMIKREAN